MARKKQEQQPEPMDPSVKEVAVAPATTYRERTAYALSTLLDEFTEVFPETEFEFTRRDGRNTALEVQITLPDEGDGLDTAAALLGAIVDERIEEIVVDKADRLASIAVWSNARTQDIRDTFALVDALLALLPEDGESA